MPPGPALDEPGRQQPHEAREADELDARGSPAAAVDARGRSPRGVGIDRDGRARGRRCPAPRAPCRARAASASLETTSAISAGWSGAARGRDQRRHVGAAARDQDGGPRAARPSQHERPAGWRRAVAPAAATMLADPDRGLAEVARRGPDRRRLVARTTTAMPMPQLKVRSISRSAMPPAARQPAEDRRRPARRRDRACDAEPVGQHARHVVDEAAAGDVGQRHDGAGPLAAPPAAACT